MAGKASTGSVSKEYSLEYGTAAIEMHKDAISKGQKVVKALFLMELTGLHGREKLKGYDISAVVTYD